MGENADPAGEESTRKKYDGCRLNDSGYLGRMDWQEVVSLVIVAAAVALLFWGNLRRRKQVFACQSHCLCPKANALNSNPSVVFRGRKGEPPEIITRMK
jgi:hypothetical protein